MPPAAPNRRAVSDVTVAAVILVLAALGGALLLRHFKAPTPPKPAAALPENWLISERQIEPTAAFKAVRARFDTATDDQGRQWALMAAAKLGEPAAVLWLAQVAATDKNFGRWAEDALARITSHQADLELGDVATSKGPPRVRVAAIRALAMTGSLPQAAQLTAVVATSSEPIAVRQAAAMALGMMGRSESVQALASALDGALVDSTHDGQQLRVIIIQALARIATSDARAVIESHAKRQLAPAERAVVDGALGAAVR